MWTYKNVSMPRSQIARNLGMAWRGAGCGIRTVCGCDCRAVDTFQFPDLMVNEADYSGARSAAAARYRNAGKPDLHYCQRTTASWNDFNVQREPIWRRIGNTISGSTARL